MTFHILCVVGSSIGTGHGIVWFLVALEQVPSFYLSGTHSKPYPLILLMMSKLIFQTQVNKAKKDRPSYLSSAIGLVTLGN